VPQLRSLGLFRSRCWECPHCKQTNLDLLPDPPAPTSEGTEQKSDPAAETTQSSTTETEPKSDFADHSTSTRTSNAADMNSPIQAAPGLTFSSPVRMNTGSNLSGQTTPIMHISTPSLRTEDFDRSQPSSSPPSAVPQSSRQTGSETPLTPVSAVSPPAQGVRRSQKPPILLDAAICILLVLLFAIICRRMV